MEIRYERAIDALLRPKYLAKTFAEQARVACYLHNISFITKAFKSRVILDLNHDRVSLFFRPYIDRNFDCILAFSKHFQFEGEMCLTLRSKNFRLYDIAFSIVPGSVVPIAEPSVILIGRMQGQTRNYDEIRAATKCFRDISPQAVLFAALQGVATALGIKSIVGVSARNQVTSVDRRVLLEKTYDEFYASVGGLGPIEGFFHLKSDHADRLEADLPKKHRARAKNKRRFKHELAMECEEKILSFLRPSADSGAPNAAMLREVQQDVVSVSAGYLHTLAGTKVGEKIVTNGKAGHLVYGPYIAIKAGEYLVRFDVRILKPSKFSLDVAASQGMVLTSKSFDESFAGSRAEIAFEAATDFYDIEFRIMVPADASIEVYRLEVERRAGNAQPPRDVEAYKAESNRPAAMQGADDLSPLRFESS